MGAECEIVAQDWDGIIPALLARKYDAIVASFNVTEDRKKVVAFTKPYYRSPSVFVVRKGTDVKDVSPKALAGKSIGVQSATNQLGLSGRPLQPLHRPALQYGGRRLPRSRGRARGVRALR